MTDILPLELRNISYDVDGLRLIEGVSLTVANGPLTMIVGPNGAGKSLLLRLCHGLLTPTDGAVVWGGPRQSDAALRQAMVFQRPVVLRRSVFANVEYPLKLRGTAKTARRRRVLEALQRTGIEHLQNRQATVLSGGEQQKLALARAWTLEPEILFLDEPTASLDPASTLDIEQLIGDIHASGIKVMMTSHNLGQLRRLADEVIFLSNGQVVEKADALSFLSDPKSPQAQAYLAGEIAV